MKQRQLFRKPMLLIPFLLLSFLGFSQVTEQWVKRYNGPTNGSDVPRSVAVDAFGNVYVTGSSATIKYDAAGNELWVRSGASSLAVDASGNVHVTGLSYDSVTGYDYITIKYDTDGNELWVTRYNGSGNSGDTPSSLAVDASGNVYVTGSSYNNETGGDYATIKYDASGNELWVRRYNGPGNGRDGATSLAVDGSGNVYVTGSSFIGTDENEFENYDYTTIKYDAAGNELWVKRYEDREFDFAECLAVDASGNVYVTGNSGYAYMYSFDYVTVKYDTDGNQLWAKRYDGFDGNDDDVSSLAIDTFGNVYVTGESEGYEYRTAYATVKYDASGNELWVKRYDGPGEHYDGATSLAIDASGNVYVTGYSFGGVTPNDYDYATIKYDAEGNELWVKRYNGSTNSDDQANSLAVDASGNVYVTGYSQGNGTDWDYVTIKYSQSQAAIVSSFTLINADTDEDLRELKDGDTINLVALPSFKLNIRANTSPGAVGSVVFSLSGAQTRTHTENIVPYALFADNTNGGYYPWIPTGGDYILTATPYSKAKGSGDKGTPLTIRFHVIYPSVNSLILVNAETDQDIKTFKNGDVIDLAYLPTDKLNIRAITNPDTVGSVVFNLNNKVIVRESYAPYAIGGDIKGDYRAWTLPTGRHTLTAIPYALKRGRGQKGTAHRVAFTVVDQSTVHKSAANPDKPIVDAAKDITESLRANPNPFSGQTTISFSVPKSGYTTVQVYDAKGTVVERLYQAWAEGGKVYRLSFNSKQLQSGVYVLRVATDKHLQSTKLVLIR